MRISRASICLTFVVSIGALACKNKAMKADVSEPTAETATGGQTAAAQATGAADAGTPDAGAYTMMARGYGAMMGMQGADRARYRQWQMQMQHMRGQFGPMHGRGMMQGRGMHGRPMMHGQGMMQGPGTCRRGSTCWSSEIDTWHQQMAELHTEMAAQAEAAGNTALAEHMRQMAAWHTDLAKTLGEEAKTGKAGAAAEDGAAIYTASCAACHGADGKGVAGAFPALAGSKWVNGPPEKLVEIVRSGLVGPVEVDGKSYDGAMPGFDDRLTDAQIAAVLTHIRTSFGNASSKVDEAAVGKVGARDKPLRAADLD